MRETILNQLKIDFLSKLTSINGYSSDLIDCVHGVADFDSIEQYPTIGYMLSTDQKREEYLDSNRDRVLGIVVYGVQEIEYSNYSNLYSLIKDIELFLMSPNWTYTDNTELGNVEIYAGGIEKEKAYFTMEIQVFYTQET